MVTYAFVGECQCGKSTFIRNFFDSENVESYATVGIDFGRVKEKDRVVEFWEIAGHEYSQSFKRIAEPFIASHLHSIDVLFTVFNSSDPASLSASLKYIEWLQMHHSIIGKVLLVGTKSDLGIHSVYSGTDCIFTNKNQKINIIP
eukprot:NODE_7_length_48057_cov_0.322240.p25 type:complete len:145 gc:universal NODE_7_length_48057_cov_0.322240:3436-3870(+)